MTYKLKDNDLITGQEEKKYTLRVRDLPIEDKPRERMCSFGPGALTMPELVAVLIGVGTRREEVMSMASRILKEYGERAIINETDPKRLAELVDIPIGVASKILAAIEIGRRMFSEKSGRPAFIMTSSQAFIHLESISESNKEQLRALYLNSRFQIVHDEIVSVGTLTANLVHPREVFKPALEKGAVGVILAHNHPSGSLEPTEADIETTEQLVKAGRVLGIDVVDHLIIVRGNYLSILKEQNK